ncbi:hypothetical protein CCP1ISM_50020 [Azospirillaceae bacterium]
MSKSSTRKYINEQYQLNTRVFSNQHKHRVTEENRHNPYWTCKHCIDWWTCMRFERITKMGCEAKLKKGGASLNSTNLPSNYLNETE